MMGGILTFAAPGPSPQREKFGSYVTMVTEGPSQLRYGFAGSGNASCSRVKSTAMNFKTSMTLKTRVHDGIVGALILTGALLGLTQGAPWLYATGALAGLMISSSFTGFCPVY